MLGARATVLPYAKRAGLTPRVKLCTHGGGRSRADRRAQDRAAAKERDRRRKRARHRRLRSDGSAVGHR